MGLVWVQSGLVWKSATPADPDSLQAVTRIGSRLSVMLHICIPTHMFCLPNLTLYTESTGSSRYGCSPGPTSPFLSKWYVLASSCQKNAGMQEQLVFGVVNGDGVTDKCMAQPAGQQQCQISRNCNAAAHLHQVWPGLQQPVVNADAAGPAAA